MSLRKRPPALELSKSDSTESLAPDALDAEVKESKSRFKRSDFAFQTALGSGSGGSVHKVIHLPTNTPMACKVIKSGVNDAQDEKLVRKRIARELHILRTCKSPNVVAFHGAFLAEHDIFMLMEFMDLGSLEGFYIKFGAFPENVIALVGKDTLTGLSYLYQNHKIVHRDIKPSNILINSSGELKIADFGVSRQLTTGTMGMTFTGTQGYLAAPAINLEVLVSIMDLLEFINVQPSLALPQGFSPEFNLVINSSLQKDPNCRISPEQLLLMEFFRNAPKSMLPWMQSLGAIPSSENVNAVTNQSIQNATLLDTQMESIGHGNTIRVTEKHSMDKEEMNAENMRIANSNQNARGI